MCVHLNHRSSANICKTIRCAPSFNNGIQERHQIDKGYVGWLTYLHSLCLGDPKGRPFYCPLTLSLNFPEHVNVTTFLGSSIMSSPVAGFLPFRSLFPFTQNLPKLEINTSSPDASVFLIISKRVSTISVDLFLGKPV